MIVRQWKGIARTDRVSEYLRHFHVEVLPALRSLPGFHGATVLRQDVSAGVEVLVLTRWESLDAIRHFAGDDLETAVVAPAARPCFHTYDRKVAHYEVAIEARP